MQLILTDVQSGSAEQFAAVPVTLGTATEWRSIYYVTYSNIVQGEVFEIHGEGQLRNDLNYNVELAQTLEVKTPNQIGGGTEPLNGEYIDVINGWDWDTTVHYGRYYKDAVFIANQNYPILYFVTRVRCRSTGAKPNDAVTVNIGQGKTYVKRYSTF